jgi:DNA (cytosine-5)-methyltransferase 1
MNVLDLFSGIGGFSLGLERAGHRTVAFCEIDSYCRAVLAKHWPDVPIFGDIRELTAEALADTHRGRQPQLTECNGQPHAGKQASRGSNPVGCDVDVICGGFPCQDISLAGKGAGIEGERSGLWKEYARIIGEVRPRYVIVENVAALLGRGLGIVLGDLAALRYDAEWHCIPASAIGAPHRRDRLWIVAYANSGRRRSDLAGGDDANGADAGRTEANSLLGAVRQADRTRDVVDTDKPRPSFGAMFTRIQSGEGSGDEGQDSDLGGWWLTEPDVGRVANGIPNRVDRLRALGNAIVPQIAEVIGRAIR